MLSTALLDPREDGVPLDVLLVAAPLAQPPLLRDREAQLRRQRRVVVDLAWGGHRPSVLLGDARRYQLDSIGVNRGAKSV